jgi:hypothetical protein
MELLSLDGEEVIVSKANGCRTGVRVLDVRVVAKFYVWSTSEV